MQNERRALLEKYTIEKDRLFFEVNVLGRVFSTSIWYRNVNFKKLKRQIGRDNLKRLVAHIAAFEMNKYGSLHLETVNLGKLSKYVDRDLQQLWSEVFINVWGQWRYENNLPHDKPPKLIANAKKSRKPINFHYQEGMALTFFGGGKDSFVSTRILKDAGIPHDILEYSSSIYGNRVEQSDVKPVAQLASEDSFINEMVVFDDFLDSPIIDYDGQEYKIHTLAAAETPASIFECLPLALYSGYNSLALGHEKSANYPNLKWELEEGAPINHQWGKSLEAQKLMSHYIKNPLSNDVHYYSTLVPLSDPAIFAIFATLPWDLIKKAHSCNVTKPWCRRCAKCVYVWLFYLAFLDDDKVTNEIFGGEVLFDIEENKNILRMLAGHDIQTPFECVGQPPETLLALAICQKKGYKQGIINELLHNYSQSKMIHTTKTQLCVNKSFLKDCELPNALYKYYSEDLDVLLEKKKTEVLKMIKS
ncbi:MAG TPA: hypothetical protein VIH90_08025 [Candidatus Saccharimonadales bacterium]